jgi:hypothetical protein
MRGRSQTQIHFIYHVLLYEFEIDRYEVRELFKHNETLACFQWK